MIDSILKDLLGNLTRINELSKNAFDELNEFLQRKDCNISNNSNFINDFSLSILPLSEEFSTFKNLSSKLLEEKSKCSNQKIINNTRDINDVTIQDQTVNQKEIEEVQNELIENMVTENVNVCEKEASKIGKIEKPILKLVDFDKLVDPRNLRLMNKNQNENNSVIILSSSEDEEPLCNKNNETCENTYKSSSEDLVPTGNSTSLTKGSSTISDKFQISINLYNHKDVKLHEAYVKLLRVPCEEMKEFYSQRMKNNKFSGELNQENLQTIDGQSTKSKKKQNSKNENQSIESSTDSLSNAGITTTKVKKNKHSRNKLSKELLTETDSSDDEPLKNIKKKKKASRDKIEHNSKPKNNVEKSGSSSEELDQETTKEDSKNSDQENSDSNEEVKSNKKTSGVEIVSDSEDSDVFLFKKKQLNTSNEQVNEKEKNSVKEIHSSNNSDDSDFETFSKKNRFIRNKKIMDSDEDQDNKNQTLQSENEIESSKSNNTSDKEEEQSQEKKRKRIKQTCDSSESDDNTTRRKIKKVISKNSLSEKTKQAAAEERERKQRILEKQKKYNQIYESSDLANSKVEKLVLDIDEATDEPLLEVDKALVSKLKPHQASGIQFMWDACFESLKRMKESKGSGCILAHCMGLGKTLQVIALTHTLLEEIKTGVKKVLIVTPLSTVLNWKAEFKNWLSDEQSFEVYELASIRSQNADRAMCLKDWHENGGVMIISYAMFRNLSNDKNKRVSKKFRTIFIEALLDPGPNLVVCDEGHLLKNEKTSLSIAMNKIKTCRRIVLTGTPLQNNLKEYYCMVQFVKPNLLGTYKEYLNRFVNPITNGQYTDSTQYDINIMRRRSHVLHKLLDGIVQRRDYSILSPYLPPKFEYVLFLTLTETQKKLYEYYLKNLARKAKDETSNRTSFLFSDFQAFSRICIHPRVLLDKSNDDQQKYQSDEESVGSLKDFIDDNGETSSSSDDSSSSESDTKETKKKHVSKRVTRAQKNNSDFESESEVEVEKEWWQQYCDGDELDNMAHSSKILMLFEILKECEQIGDKVLVFSQSLYALNLIEYFLDKVDAATQNGDADEKTCGFTGSWSPGIDYFRLDGSTNCGLRSEWCDSFNREDNSRARLFLLSTRAGGLGINLVAANRVILFDVSWNPSSDLQSIYRVYRFGQLKPSYVYRFVIYGTMEMKIYERQVTKQAISKRVIDEQQIDRHYNQNDLAELYKYEEPDLDVRPIPLVPKDVLLAELLQNQEDKIFKYHEHQSLLENKEDEILNEEERKAAWDEFENEKVERVKQTLIGKFNVSTVQLALKSIIQRDNPAWNNNQILSIIPQLIQQLNMQLSIGDQTMYNRIAEEIKNMQEVYARKMQMQFYQYRMQNPQFQNFYQQQYQMMNNRFAVPGGSNLNPNAGSNFNSGDIVELN